MQKKELDSTKIKILVCCHKPCELPKDDVFLPIQVGAAISDVDLGMQRDDQVNGESCDNISTKNKSYCELTAMYWAWKNIKKLYPDLEYIGLNHYRRYFAADCYDTEKTETRIGNYKLPISIILRKLSKYKGGIIARPVSLPYSLSIAYCVAHNSSDFRILKDIIKSKYSDYIPYFEKEIELGNKFSAYNMFVLKIDDFSSYCEWLFGILSEIEEKCNITNYDAYQKRIYGFMAERLLRVWCSKNIKMRYMSVVKFCTPVMKISVSHQLKNICKAFVYEFVFLHIRRWGKIFDL